MAIKSNPYGAIDNDSPQTRHILKVIIYWVVDIGTGLVVWAKGAMFDHFDKGLLQNKEHPA